jgi:hypothetical protein
VRGRILIALAVAAALAGCGGSEGGGAASPNARAAPPSPQIAAAQRPQATDFPAPNGRTLQQLADTLLAGPEAGLATSVHPIGTARVAFGVIGADNAFLYGPTAVYVAHAPDAPARGPYLAPAGSLQVRPPFRSRTSGGAVGEVEAIYHAEVPLPRPGRWYVLTATRQGDRLLGASTVLDAQRRDPIPAAGERAPRVATPTLASAGGDAAAIDTRRPPDDMHEVSLDAVLGRRPVVLLFATPALCESRVCGPVVDVALQLKAAYGDRVAFIHNEVYVDNDPSKGLRPQLRAFGLETEPWLFAIDGRGRVAARLEGAFGFDEVRAAIEAALSPR